MTVGEIRYPQKSQKSTKRLAPAGRIGNPNDPWIIPIPTSHKLSTEKNPGCLGYLRDEILPNYMGIIS